MSQFGLVTFDLETKRFYPVSFLDSPMPGGVDGGRYRSIGHHPEGFEDMASAVADLKKLLPDEAIISTHVMPVADTKDMAMIVITGWKPGRQITAKDPATLGGSLPMIKTDELSGFLEAPKAVGMVAYNESGKRFIPMVFGLSQPADGEKNATFDIAGSIKAGFSTLEHALEAFKQIDVPPYGVLRDHVLPVANIGEVDHASLQVANFSESKPLSSDHIKNIMMPERAEQTGELAPVNSKGEMLSPASQSRRSL